MRHKRPLSTYEAYDAGRRQGLVECIHQYIDQIEKLRWKVDEQDSRIKELEEALRPFAEAYDEVKADFPDISEHAMTSGECNLADLRRARQILNKGKPDA